MNWVLPIGATIGTFIGVYLPTQSFSQALFGALGAFVAGIVISLIIKKDHNIINQTASIWHKLLPPYAIGPDCAIKMGKLGC